jgi:hypothetical protein
MVYGQVYVLEGLRNVAHFQMSQKPGLLAAGVVLSIGNHEFAGTSVVCVLGLANSRENAPLNILLYLLMNYFVSTLKYRVITVVQSRSGRSLQVQNLRCVNYGTKPVFGKGRGGSSAGPFDDGSRRRTRLMLAS